MSNDVKDRVRSVNLDNLSPEVRDNIEKMIASKIASAMVGLEKTNDLLKIYGLKLTVLWEISELNKVTSDVVGDGSLDS